MKNKTIEVPQLPEDRRKKYSDQLKSILYLYGQHDAGKSTTLGWLLFYLAYGNNNEDLVSRQFDEWKDKLRRGNKKKNSFPDIRVIVPYEVKEATVNVYIALFGDTLETNEANVFFFEGRLDYKKVYILDKNKGIRKLNDQEKVYYSLYRPSVCVSASFYTRLVEEPLWYFAGKKHLYSCMTNWICIPRCPEKNDEQIKNKCQCYAKLLKRLIDESLMLK